MHCQASRTPAFILTLCLLAAAPALEAQDGNLRYSIMVSKFTNDSGWQGQWELGRAWGTILTDQLSQTGRFIVIAENDMREEAGKEQVRALSGVTAQGKKAPVTGQMTPAQLLVKGSVTHFQHGVSKKKGGVKLGGIGIQNSKETAEINVTLQIVDSTTGMVVASQSVVGKSEKKNRSFRVKSGDLDAGQEIAQNDNVKTAISDAVADAVRWMSEELDDLPWRGTIVHVEDEFIYINRGSREGVSEGMTFVVGESKLIRDPATGEVLDEFVTERGRIRAVRVRDKTAVCQLTDGKMNAVFKGMGVTPGS